MEDVHWIDPETLTLLRHFIKTVNRNTYLRKNLCIIITFLKRLNNLNEAGILELLHSCHANLVDFVKNLSIEKNKFRIVVQ